MSRKEVVKLQPRLCDFVLNFQVSRRACYSFWGIPNLVIYHWNFANPCKNFGARAKKHLLAASHRHLVGTDFLWRCLGMSPKLATAQMLTVPQPCFQRWRLKSTGQVSPVYLYKEGLDEPGGQPVLPCLSKRLCYLISKLNFLYDRFENYTN